MEDTWFCRSVRERERSMFRLAWAMLRNEADCEDAVQSAILKAYEALPALRDKNAFGSWLLRILQRECLQLLKKRPQTLPLEKCRNLLGRMFLPTEICAPPLIGCRQRSRERWCCFTTRICLSGI